MKILTGTTNSLASLAILMLRCTVGIIFFIGATGKAFQWFNGFGMETTIHYFSLVGISRFWTYVSVYTEIIGGLLLIIGLLTRVAAFALTINMIVAFIVTLPNGFVAQNGASTPFTFLVIVFAILLTGPMMFSLDAVIERKKISDDVKQRNFYREKIIS
jgi:putative oxidoreductase